MRTSQRKAMPVGFKTKTECTLTLELLRDWAGLEAFTNDQQLQLNEPTYSIDFAPVVGHHWNPLLFTPDAFGILNVTRIKQLIDADFDINASFTIMEWK